MDKQLMLMLLLLMMQNDLTFNLLKMNNFHLHNLNILFHILLIITINFSIIHSLL